MWRNWNTHHCQKECKILQPQWKKACLLLRKINLELAYDPGIPLPGIYPR